MTREEKRREESLSTNVDKEKRGKHAARPSIEEVREYCQERGNGIDADHFIDHYTANGWRQSNGNLIRDWKAAVRTWEKRSFQVAGSSKKEIF